MTGLISGHGAAADARARAAADARTMARAVNGFGKRRAPMCLLPASRSSILERDAAQKAHGRAKRRWTADGTRHGALITRDARVRV